MPAYNAARYLKPAVYSIFDQTYPYWELLLVDDASSDNTPDLMASLAAEDTRVRVFRQSRNKGVASARNHGLDHARGKYIAFLDSDDLWEPQKLALQVAFLESSEALVCYSAYRRIDQDGNFLATVSVPATVTYRGMLRTNQIGNLTGIYNVQVLGKQYFADFRHEDYVAWLELIKKSGSAFAVNQVLASYRVYRGSLSANKLRTISWQWRIYRESQYLGYMESAWYMLCYALNALKKRKKKIL